jgi:hypothetical protein
MSQTYIPVAMRKVVRDRAKDRCEYCLIHSSMTFAMHCIDHIVAEKHGGATDANNLANSCTICNLHKGTDLTSIDSETGFIVPPFNPRRDRWRDHFRVTGGLIEPLTPTGRATERLLQFNAKDRVKEREQLMAAGLLLVPTEMGAEQS